MNKAIRDVWIAALRSGKYKQGAGFLRTREKGKKTSYCCLGVLCNLGVQKDWKAEEDGNFTVFGYGDGGYTTHLPPDVSGIVGLSVKEAEWLAQMNDDGQSFDAIADHIELML